MLTSKEINYADSIDDISIVENILKDDTIQKMDKSLLLLNPNYDFSFENRLEENLNLANKNKQIQEQECKLKKLDHLVEGLMGQIQMYKLQEQKLKHEKWQHEILISKIQEENKSLKNRCQMYKAAVVKLSGYKPNRKESKQNKTMKSNQTKTIPEPRQFSGKSNRDEKLSRSKNICFRFRDFGDCTRIDCKFRHPVKNGKSLNPFLYCPPSSPARWKPQTAPLESWRNRGVTAVRHGHPSLPPATHHQSGTQRLYSRVTQQSRPSHRSATRQ